MNWILFAMLGVVGASNYSYPRILIIGPTGVGKSSLGNVLAGCEPSDENCFFPICNGIDSCTKETTIAETVFLGQLAGNSTAMLDGNVTLIDSPGFGDTDLEEPTLIAEMIDVLKNKLEDANTILLCFEMGRWNDGVLKMIEELESLFGRDRLWNNVILEITKWAFDSKSIADRERQGITEDGTLEEINKKLKENFHLNHTLPGVFIDSYAVYYLETDEVQKQHFFNYSLTLWEAANAMETFTFYTIEDILNQLHTCQIKNDCLNDVLEERITNLENNVISINSTVTNDINELTTDVATNDKRIQDNFLLMDSNFNSIAQNNKSIDLNANKINNNTKIIEINTGNIVTNKNNIDDNSNKIDANTRDIDTNSGKIKTNKDNIDTNTDDISTNTNAITGLTEKTSRNVSYCGYNGGTGQYFTGTITYSRLATSVNSFSPKGGLDTSTGVFTAPTDGTYLITYNFYTYHSGYFEVYINYNGHDLDEGIISSYSTDDDRDMTGRTLTLQLKTNDKLYIHVYSNANVIYRTTFCITLLH